VCKGIFPCAVTQTIAPAAAAISQGMPGATHTASRAASRAPAGSTKPEPAPPRKARHRVPPACRMGRLTAAPSGTFCSPMPKASAAAPENALAPPEAASAAARPMTMPSGRLCSVMASTTRPLCPRPPESSPPATCSSQSRPNAPMHSPAAGGSHAGTGPPAARPIAGSSRLHTLAASITPAAKPSIMRWARGPGGRRRKKTDAAPSAVQAVGISVRPSAVRI
jgi:hypothetical protein